MMDKVRVHEIARELGINSKEVVDKASAMGLNVKTASSSVSIEEAEQIMNYIMSGASTEISNKLISNALLPESHIPSSVDLEKIRSVGLSISSLKSVGDLTWSFEFKKGLHAIIAENGSGKSSLIVSLGKLVTPKILGDEFVGKGYENSTIRYSLDQYMYSWQKKPNWSMVKGTTTAMPTLKGVIESSILSGSRFKNIPAKRREREINELIDDVDSVDEFIVENMNYILYGKEEGKFTDLYFVTANARVRKRRKKDELPIFTFYALKRNNAYIKEYFFSTGEYFLLSLLKFINAYRHNVHSYPALIIIDEIELSLHPLAQKRLVEKVIKFSEQHNILFIFATHSLQIIESISPSNIHYLENHNGICHIISPIYPSYLSSKLYIHNSYDFVILVEDKLAKQYVDKIIRNNLKRISMSFMVIPIGGWEKIFEMYQFHHTHKIYGSAKVLIIFDGDVQHMPKAKEKKYNSYPKRFLPFDNIEKLVVNYLKNRDHNFFVFIESYLMGIDFSILNLDIKDDSTDQVKHTFNKFTEKMAKQCMISEDMMMDKIIDQIIKQNELDEKSKQLELSICDFLELGVNVA